MFASNEYLQKVSSEQALTFDYLMRYLQKKQISISKQDFYDLGLIDEEGVYTNLALLLSGECPFTIKVGVYPNDSFSSFRDKREFEGCLLEQIDDCRLYLKLCNRTVSTFEGLRRIECSDYPSEVTKVALLNTIVGRNYSTNASLLVHVMKSNIEFITVGTLVDFGDDKVINKKLIEVLQKLEIVNDDELGVEKINEFYSDDDMKPIVEKSPNAFKIILPSRNVD